MSVCVGRWRVERLPIVISPKRARERKWKQTNHPHVQTYLFEILNAFGAIYVFAQEMQHESYYGTGWCCVTVSALALADVECLENCTNCTTHTCASTRVHAFMSHTNVPPVSLLIQRICIMVECKCLGKYQHHNNNGIGNIMNLFCL